MEINRMKKQVYKNALMSNKNVLVFAVRFEIVLTHTMNGVILAYKINSYDYL